MTNLRVPPHSIISEPLVVDPRGHISDSDHDDIVLQFEKARGANDAGPPMYIIAPYNRQDQQEDEENDPQHGNADKSSESSIWLPSIESPEWVVVKRAAALARRSHEFLMDCIINFDENKWAMAFHETASSFQSYSVLLRVDSDFVFDLHSSSTSGELEVSPSKEGALHSAYTRSMIARFAGPKPLRRKVYRNLQGSEREGVLLHWDPIQSLVNALTEKFGRFAAFFYNDLSPEVIALRWRPETFSLLPFSVMTSKYVRPAEKSDWKSDSFVVRSADDILRDMRQYYHNFVTTVKIFDGQEANAANHKRRKIEKDNEDDNVNGIDGEMEE